MRAATLKRKLKTTMWIFLTIWRRFLDRDPFKT
jgi:hypothetical protein